MLLFVWQVSETLWTNDINRHRFRFCEILFFVLCEYTTHKEHTTKKIIN